MMNALEKMHSNKVAADERGARWVLAPVMQISKCFSLNECKDKFVKIIDADAEKKKISPACKFFLLSSAWFIVIMYCSGVSPILFVFISIHRHRSGQRRISTFQCKVHRGNGIQSAFEIEEKQNESGKKTDEHRQRLQCGEKENFAKQN